MSNYCRGLHRKKIGSTRQDAPKREMKRKGKITQKRKEKRKEIR
jgi:hypothetical protein